MLGAAEYYKWPQVHDSRAAFALAAPMLPQLKMLLGQSFPLTDDQQVLSEFVDEGAPFFHITSKHFRVTDSFPTGEYGRLVDDTLARMRTSITEILVLATRTALVTNSCEPLLIKKTTQGLGKNGVHGLGNGSL